MPKVVKDYCPVKTWLLVMSFSLAAFAQPASHKLVINIESPEGQLLQQIALQTEEPRKLALMEEFVSKYPKYEGVAWVYGQLQPLYIKQGQFNTALEIGDKALAIDPGEVDAAYYNLKAAEGKKDPDLIVKWAVATAAIARKTAENPAVADRAKQIDRYCEYALYSAARQSTDAVKTIALVETLEQLNAHSQYLPKVYTSYFNALRQAGQAEKAGLKAEKMAESSGASVDVLLVAADFSLQKKNEPDKVLAYSSRIVEALNAKPDSVGETEWAKKRESTLALVSWMQGVVYSLQGKWFEADKSLRGALPGLLDQQVRASSLYYLGLVDYQIAKIGGRDKAWMQEALRFSEQSAAIESPLQAQAEKTVRMIRVESAAK